jgi:colicin import membrane protein
MHRPRRDKSPPPRQEEDDPFRYGWRYVRRRLPDGSEVVDQVPLSEEDVLYPEEDDFVVQKPPHLRDFFYCYGALDSFYADRPDVVVLGDCRVDWGVEGVRPLGPDVLVLFDVCEWRQAGTFRIAEEGGRPVLVLEIASPSTWKHDLYRKPDLYYRAGVQRYAIVDRGPDGDDPPRLLGYQRGPQGWLELPLDAQGRLDLAPVPLLLGLEGDRPRLYDVATAQMLPDRTELTQALAETEAARAKAERKAQKEGRVRAKVAKKAEEEAKAREEAEEAARKEAKARAKAEREARKEAKARAALERRLRELEERLRRERGED